MNSCGNPLPGETWDIGFPVPRGATDIRQTATADEATFRCVIPAFHEDVTEFYRLVLTGAGYTCNVAEKPDGIPGKLSFEGNGASGWVAIADYSGIPEASVAFYIDLLARRWSSAV